MKVENYFMGRLLKIKKDFTFAEPKHDLTVPRFELATIYLKIY